MLALQRWPQNLRNTNSISLTVFLQSNLIQVSPVDKLRVVTWLCRRPFKESSWILNPLNLNLVLTLLFRKQGTGNLLRAQRRLSKVEMRILFWSHCSLETCVFYTFLNWGKNMLLVWLFYSFKRTLFCNWFVFQLGIHLFVGGKPLLLLSHLSWGEVDPVPHCCSQLMQIEG